MRPGTRTATVAVIGLALSVAAAGCSDDDSDTDDEAVTSLAQDYSVRGALEEVPTSDVEAQVLVQTADLAEATEVAGLERPTEGSREATADWLLGLSADPDGAVFVPLADLLNLQAASPDEFADVLGWSVLDVTSFVELGDPPEQFAVVTGDFDESTLSDDLIEVEDGIVSDREGEDHETNLEDPGALNQIGVPTRVSQRGERIALSPSTPRIQAWLDGDETLADDESMAAVAEGLDDEDVVSAVLTRVEGGDPAGDALGERGTDEQRAALADELEGLLPEDPYDAVGIGWSVEDGESEVHVVYHFTSSSGAESAAPALEKAYREGTSVASRTPYADYVDVQDVEAEGSVVTVTVRPAEGSQISFLYEALQQREPLFVSR